jgi:hypothetical protein
MMKWIAKIPTRLKNENETEKSVRFCTVFDVDGKQRLFESGTIKERDH